ncbi:MAG TPA: vanadium-dependent haloperoxidase [Longimicrobiales bacterium]
MRRVSLSTPVVLALAAGGLAWACTDVPIAPMAESRNGTESITFWQNNPAVYWNGVARELVATQRSPAPVAIRGYAIVAVAQYNAAVAAEKGKVQAMHPSVRAAIAAASVEALAYLYPALEVSLRDHLEAYVSTTLLRSELHTDIEAGSAIGRAVGAQVVARAQGDAFFAPWTGTVPVGPGLWFSSSPPVGGGWGLARTYVLESADQFRPPPHPDFGSAAFLAALQEVRQFSDTRTAAQDAIAKFWDFPAGTYTPPGYWNEEGARLAVKYRLGARAAAHMFALLHIVAYDGLVASHEAKYHYWLLRPTMADPQITTAIVLPNFPSYPSNHAVVSGGMAAILSALFPAERKRLEALAEEAALSRVYGGIHYRFDGEAGLVLGRRIAAWALEQDEPGREPFTLD